MPRRKVKKFFKPEIRILLYTKDIKLGSVAEKCGVDIAYVSRVLRGKQVASAKVIGCVSEVLGLPKEYLFIPTITPVKKAEGLDVQTG